MIRKSKDYLIDKEVDESNGVLVFMIFWVTNSFDSSISIVSMNQNVNYLLDDIHPKLTENFNLYQNVHRSNSLKQVSEKLLQQETSAERLHLQIPNKMALQLTNLD